MSLEYMHNKLPVGLQISSIEVSKQMPPIASGLQQNLQQWNPSERLLSQERRGSEGFLVSLNACAAFLQGRAYRSSKGHDSCCDCQPFL